MSDQRSNERSNGGCLTAFLFAVAVVLALALGGVGGAMLDAPQMQRQTTIYPPLTVVPETLHIVPSAQVLTDVPTNCADPLAPSPGWENGVGGQLPPCWASWSREQQNAFLRSH